MSYARPLVVTAILGALITITATEAVLPPTKIATPDYERDSVVSSLIEPPSPKLHAPYYRRVQVPKPSGDLVVQTGTSLAGPDSNEGWRSWSEPVPTAAASTSNNFRSSSHSVDNPYASFPVGPEEIRVSEITLAARGAPPLSRAPAGRANVVTAARPSAYADDSVFRGLDGVSDGPNRRIFANSNRSTAGRAQWDLHRHPPPPDRGPLTHVSATWNAGSHSLVRANVRQLAAAGGDAVGDNSKAGDDESIYGNSNHGSNASSGLSEGNVGSDFLSAGPVVSFTFSGKYQVLSTLQHGDPDDATSNPEQPKPLSSAALMHDDDELWDRHGALHAIWYSRPSPILTARLVALEIQFRPTKNDQQPSQGPRKQRSLFLSGLSFRDVKTAVLQGHMFLPDLQVDSTKGVPPDLSSWGSPENTNSSKLGSFRNVLRHGSSSSAGLNCRVIASLRFNEDSKTRSSSRVEDIPLEASWGLGPAPAAQKDWFYGLHSEQPQAAAPEITSNPPTAAGSRSFLRRLYGADSSTGSSSIQLKSDSVSAIIQGDTVSLSGPGTILPPVQVHSLATIIPPRRLAATEESLNLEEEEHTHSSAENPLSKFSDLTGSIDAPDCGVRIIVGLNEVDLLTIGNRVVQFALFYVIKCLVEIRLFALQIHHTEGGSSSPQKVSFVSLALQTCVDCYEVVLLLLQSMAASFMTSTFIILAILKILFISLVELRYFITVLKARYSDPAMDPNNPYSEQHIPRLLKLHACASALLLIWTIRLVDVAPLAISSLYLFWIPQMTFDVYKGHRKSLDMHFVVGISICRFLLPLYIWGHPYSIFDGDVFPQISGSPSWTVVITVGSILTLQVIILAIQRIFGPRCFVPAKFLPDVYDYYRPLPITTHASSTASVEDSTATRTEAGAARDFECIICMTEISYTPRTLVITPCDHIFHESCLLKWMEVKPECPTCRGTLPPFP